MEQKLVTCPRCKGCGEVKNIKKRNRAPISDDPNLKGCAKCQQLKTRDNYYAGTGWCKLCQNKKVRLGRYNPVDRKKFDALCQNCGIKFKGYKKNVLFCSQRCNCLNMNKRKLNKAYNSLPNELRDQLIESDY